MYVVALVLGVLAAMAGAAALVFGFSIKEFTFGSTLLITGTTALVGGLVMIAVGGATRELNRIAKALNRPPLAPRVPRPGEPFDPYAPGSFRPGAPRAPAMPFPPAPMPPPASTAPVQAPAPAAPKLETPAPHAAAKTEPTPPPASPAQPVASAAGAEPVSRAEPEFAFYDRAAPGPLPEEDHAAGESAAQLEESEAVPLSPDEVPRARAFEALNEMPEPSPARRAEDARQAARDAPADEDTDLGEPAPKPWPPGSERRLPFDAIWPPRELPSTRQFAETEDDDTVSRGDDADISAEEAASPATAPVAESGASWQPEDTVAQPQAAHAHEADVPEEPPHAVSILKSGVVDGMAYTLYSDGSIEAELPSGMIRFASIDELRMHLEKTG